MLKKGDRVEFTMGSATIYGVVEKGGKKVRVITDGGQQTFTGGAHCFKHSNKPLPEDPCNPMTPYSVKSYKENKLGGDETRMFTATVCKNGKTLLYVRNGGSGGPNEYQSIPASDNAKLEAEFYNNAKAWAIQFGDKDPIEPEDSWVEWYVHDRPYGILSETYLETFKD